MLQGFCIESYEIVRVILHSSSLYMLIFHGHRSPPDQTPRLTNSPHMASCIETCSLGYPGVYTYSLSVAIDSGRGWQSTPHYFFPCSTMIQTVHPPLKSLQVHHQLVSSRCPVLDGAPEMDWGRYRSPWIGRLEPFPSVLRWPTGLCFSGVHVRNQIHPFQGVWKGGGMKGEMKGEWKKQKMKNYLCLSAITWI